MGFVLTTDKLRRLYKHDFELLCRKILDAEKAARFRQGTVDIAGPNPEDFPDGGRDLVAVIRERAHTPANTLLLREDPGEILFSCKSHKEHSSTKNPRTWLKQVRNDIDPAPSVYDARSKKPATVSNEEIVERTSGELADILRRVGQGAFYCVLLNVEAVDRIDAALELAVRMRLRAKVVLGSTVEIRDDQVRVLDAHEIVNAFNELSPTLPPDLETKLGGSDDDFRSWAGWTEHISNERRRMGFVRDRHREALDGHLEQLIMDRAGTSLWVVGAPGVGKTRAVHRFFETHTDLQHRVRHTEDWEDARRWLEHDGPRSTREVILVVDEVPSSRGDELARTFRRAAQGTLAKLVMIGTGVEGQGQTSEVLPLSKIDADEFRRLIETELDQTEIGGDARARVTGVVEQLSQGYPLFAMWLARGLANNPEFLDDPGTGLTDAQDPWLATQLVLASPADYSSDIEWKDSADRRGKALLLVLLAPYETSSTLSPQEEGDFADGLLRSWSELESAKADCRARGILRQTRRGHLYISPANLERLILNHYFGGPTPPIDPRRLRARLGSRVDRLLVRAQHVEASASCRKNLAEALLEPTLEDLRAGNRGRGILLRIARELPEALARRAHADAGRAEPGSWLANELADCYRHLRHRAIDQDVFALVEDALFALERTEDWSWIFASGFHATYQPFDVRLRLLERRLGSSDPIQRRRAVAGLEHAVDPRGGPATNVGLDDIDSSTAGPWETPSIDEAARRAAKGWALLLRATGDEDPEVAGAARGEVAETLRQGLEFGLWARPELLDELLSEVPGWTPSQRNALDAELDVVDRYDSERLQGAPARLHDGLTALREVLRPSSLEERLIAQVGRWSPISDPIDEADRRQLELEADRALARELIATPDVLEELHDWLDSPKAFRASALGWALGEVDEDLTLLSSLLSHARADALRSVVTGYLAAWANRAPDAFDAWIEEDSNLDGLDEIIAAALVRSKSSVLRTNRLIRLIQRGSISPPTLRGIGSWGWSEGLPTNVLDRLITALVDTNDAMMARHAVGLAWQRLKTCPVDETIADSLVRLVDTTRSLHLPATGERDWASIVMALVEAGRGEAIDAVVDAFDDVGYSHQAEEAIRQLVRNGHTLTLWEHLEPKLDEDPSLVIPLEFTVSHTLFREQLPIDVIMRWVGDDLDRATTAARLTTPYAEELDPLARALIERFGAKSRPARGVSARVGSTPTTVSSIARFFERQAEHATSWARHGDGEVVRWAEALASSLHERAAAEREEDELMRKLA